MQKFSDYLLSQNGSPIDGASIQVNLAGTSTSATLFSDNAGTALVNPVTSEADGSFEFYAENGRYDLIPTKTGVTFDATDLTDKLLDDPAVVNTTLNDVDAQNDTLLVADLTGGITVHTSVTGAGTVTTDSADNIVAGVPLLTDGDTARMYYINDGTEVLTFVGGASVTIADTGQTIAANEAAVLLFRRVTATTVTCYIIGA